MKIVLSDLLKQVEGELLTQQDSEISLEINGGYVSDLLSDVMGNAREGEIWITIMKHLNVIAVASLANLSAIIFSRGITPEPVVIEKAAKENICLIKSGLSTFEIAGRLHKLLN
jgi:DRTGG domain.